ncbi:MAG: UbiH/UbiF/VisC/COQ6 family ubiquinone biosynthesis hydroxylase [Azospirillaceae bacterium]|nr:UbiH/UbiF/VisC/COQ6 family ubiquinone biosynthesis hydroxylase [Azospirillaceae bacterium]
MSLDVPCAAPARQANGDLTTEVIIVGGGLAGLSLATALATAGVPVVCIDRDSPSAQCGASYDHRTSALAYCSQKILDVIGVWPYLAADGAPITDIRVVDGASPLFLHYDHKAVGLGPFGFVVDNIAIRRALFQRLAQLPDLIHLAPATVTAVERGVGHAEVTLAGGRVIRGRLVVGADGKGSFCRQSAGIGLTRARYNQSAIICNIATEYPHHGVAVEHFHPQGPFALLPLTGNRVSVVWTEPTDMVSHYLSLSDAVFTAELQRRAGDWLGAVHPITPRVAYPLGISHAARYTADRLALIAEAAHTMHPIAGQGLNVGLRDVAALAEVITDAYRLGMDTGTAAVLERYQRWRRFDTVLLLGVTDGLTRLFSNDIAPVRVARDVGMALVNRLPGVKKVLMRHAMGIVGDLPRMIRGEAL